MKTKKEKPQSRENYEASRMWKCIRMTLAMNFPDCPQEIALMVLLRLATHIAVDCTSLERAPAVISRLVNEFLRSDHYDNE